MDCSIWASPSLDSTRKLFKMMSRCASIRAPVSNRRRPSRFFDLRFFKHPQGRGAVRRVEDQAAAALSRNVHQHEGNAHLLQELFGEFYILCAQRIVRIRRERTGAAKDF